MSKKFIELGETFFENKKIDMEYFNDFKKLRDCYTSWSDAKENIYNKYANLIANNVDEVINYGIRSYSGWIITLHAIVEKDGKRLYLVITPGHNWYKEI